MKDFHEAREHYMATPIPEELADRVQAGIRQGKREYRAARRRRSLWRSLSAAAACFVVLVGTLNLSATAAAAAADVPVLGGLFQVLTVRHYETAEDGVNYQVTVPEVENDSALADQVNAAIQARVDAHLEKARRDWEEYREAFFATGGTEEEWGGREMDVIVDYEVKRQTDTQVSFVVTLAEGWVASMQEQYYYNLDLAEDRDLTLRDLLGDDWTARCNDAVKTYIAGQTDADGFSYFFGPDEGGFTTVDETTTFYIREDGAVVLTFPKYAIAAGAAGIVEVPVE